MDPSPCLSKHQRQRTGVVQRRVQRPGRVGEKEAGRGGAEGQKGLPREGLSSSSIGGQLCGLVGWVV